MVLVTDLVARERRATVKQIQDDRTLLAAGQRGERVVVGPGKLGLRGVVELDVDAAASPSSFAAADDGTEQCHEEECGVLGHASRH